MSHWRHTEAAVWRIFVTATTWQVQVRRKGMAALVATFPTQRDAERWAKIQEGELASGAARRLQRQRRGPAPPSRPRAFNGGEGRGIDRAPLKMMERGWRRYTRRQLSFPRRRRVFCTPHAVTKSGSRRRRQSAQFRQAIGGSTGGVGKGRGDGRSTATGMRTGGH